MKALGVYTRVSRRGEREEGRYHSPHDQDATAREYARRRGLPVGRTFHDENVSGAVHPDERPRMRELLDRVRSGELGGVVAFALDRLTRDPSHGDWLVREVTSHDGVVVAPDVPEDLTSPTDEFQFGVLLGVARLYRRTASARFAGAKERATRAGVPVGPVPFGYRRHGHPTRPPAQWGDDERRIVPDEGAAPAVRALFEMRARRPQPGYSECARMLDGRTERVWSRQGVAALLKNELYKTGRIEYGGVISDVATEPLVDVPTWAAAQTAKDAKPRAKRNPDSPWLLTGLARCSACGNALTPWRGPASKPNVRPRYRCATRGCGSYLRSVAAPDLEALVVETAFRLLGSRVETRGDAADTSGLEEELARAERRLEQVMADGVADDLGDLWAPEVRRRREARDAAAAVLGAARADNGPPASDVVDLRETWDELPPAERRDALSSLYGVRFAIVRLDERGPLAGRVELTWR